MIRRTLAVLAIAIAIFATLNVVVPKAHAGRLCANIALLPSMNVIRVCSPGLE